MKLLLWYWYGIVVILLYLLLLHCIALLLHCYDVVYSLWLFVADMLGVPPGKSLYDSCVFTGIERAKDLPIVAIPSARLTAQERRKSESEGRKLRKRATLFSANPLHYNSKFHLAVAKMSRCSKSASFTYRDFMTPDSKGKFLVTNDDSPRYFCFCLALIFLL